MSALGFERHDHDRCIADAMAALEAKSTAKRLQLTPVRRRVMEILLQEHRAMGAYEVLDILRTEGLGSQPPVAYRALEFLVKHGFAHRVERLNAFIACAQPGTEHAPTFLICGSCNAVVEAPGRPAARAVKDTSDGLGFAVNAMTIEAEGTCSSCATGAA